MKRAALAIVATVAGLVVLLSFKTHAPPAPTRALSPATPGSGTSGSAPGTSAGGGSAATPPTGGPDTSGGMRTLVGHTVMTRFGPVQVEVVATGKRLVDVQALQLPSNSRRDLEIDNYAVPQLRQEALDAQSANIDMVSGATYTSDGYIQSLQSALDQLGG